MNNMTRNNVTPADEEEELMECPNCLGTGEVFESTDEEGLIGEMEVCTVCDGHKEIPRVDGYTALLDHIDDEADNSRDNYFLDDDY